MTISTESEPVLLWRPTSVIFFSIFLVGLASTTLGSSLPYLLGDLSVSEDAGHQALLPGAALFYCFLIVAPWLARRLGARRLALIATSLFVLAALAGAFSPNIAILMISIAIRDIARGIILSQGLGFVATALPTGRRAEMLGLLLLFYFAGQILGPILGGVLTDSFSWRWTMLVFAPLGSVLLALQFFQRKP